MTLKDDLFFVFDGITSKDMGIINVHFDSGVMIEEQFMSEQTINEEKIRHNDTPYYIGKERSPFTLNFSFAFLDYFDEYKLNEVTNWLGNQNYYKELYFSNNIDKKYFVMYTGSPSLLHNSLSQGYITISMRSISPYTYSPTLIEGPFDLSQNSLGFEMNLRNIGNLSIKPVIEIEKTGAGSIEIINYSGPSTESFKVVNLVDKERLVIDCNKNDILSNIPLTYHFDDVIGKYPTLVPGDNYIKIIGNCNIVWKYRCMYNQC